MERLIEPEWLDTLPAEDPRARRSRGDLRRINWFMNSAGLVVRALRHLPQPRRVLDIGAGDGSFALKVAQGLSWRHAEFILVDRGSELAARTSDGFRAMDCHVNFWKRDALGGLGEIGAVDVAWVNLFLHHFHGNELERLLVDIAASCQVFVACEPRRSAFALLASRCLALIGCNDVTRHDAVISVRAGFDTDELSRLWPQPAEWSLNETSAGLFSHLFVARRI